MFFKPQLSTGILLKRYKRFLVDVQPIGTENQILTIHCPNTGSMRSCSEPGSLVAFSRSDNPKRKYPHTLEMVQVENHWVGVNTARTNHLVAEAITEGKIKEFSEVENIKREVKVSSGSRLDLLVSHANQTTYVEIKNCSLVENGCAMFPDSVTERGTKHLRELISLKKKGENSCIFFLIQRMDADHFEPAAHIDPLYSSTLKEAADKGVLILTYQAKVTPEQIEISRQLPFTLPG